MIMVVCGHYPVYDRYGIATGKTEFGVSHGYNMETGCSFPLPHVRSPAELGAVYDRELDEWVLLESDDTLK